MSTRGCHCPGTSNRPGSRSSRSRRRLTPLPVDPTPVGPIEVQIWAPDGIAPGFELPLLLAHDGPEFAAYAGLTHYVGAMVADGTLPPLRLALIRPGSAQPLVRRQPAVRGGL